MDKVNPFFGAGAVQSLIERPNKKDDRKAGNNSASDAPAFSLNGGSRGASLTLNG